MTKLNGMGEISNFFGFSHATILDLIRNQDFPARKVTGGIWMSDTELINDWRKNQIVGGGFEKETKKRRKKKS